MKGDKSAHESPQNLNDPPTFVIIKQSPAAGAVLFTHINLAQSIIVVTVVFSYDFQTPLSFFPFTQIFWRVKFP